MHAWLDAPVRGALVEGLGDELSEFAPGLAIYEALSERDGQVLMTSLSTTLVAISAGAVFMGANTYIGNAPNFMVRSVAQSRGVRMPGFFGYMLWSGAILLPLFGLLTLVFF